MRCPFCTTEVEETRFCGSCGALLTVESEPPAEETAPDRNVGRVIANRYQLGERIASGAVGALYAATQLSNNRRCAVKLLHPSQAPDPQLTERFRREGLVLSQLRSPHTITTYEFDRDDSGTLYIAMERPEGPNLAEVLELEGALAWVRALRIIAGVCDALAEAHGAGIVHRDLRPENCVLESRLVTADFVKVLDFGLAWLASPQSAISHPGQTVGALAYASPEQLAKKPIDARSDIYGLGLLAYQLLVGKHPFADSFGPGKLVEAHLTTVPGRPSASRAEIPKDVDEIVARCLEKDPERRFPTAVALRAMIDVALLTFGPQSSDTIREPPR